jgi:hypothetical protein
MLSYSIKARAQVGGSSEGWKLTPAIMYEIWDDSKSGGSETNTTRLLGDLSLGYQFDSLLYLGGIYDYDQTQTTGGSTSTATTNSYGPSLGLVSDNLYLIFSYLLGGNRVESNGSSITYTGTSGYIVSLGYKFATGGSWGIAPQLSYRSLHYNSVDPGASADVTHTTLLPYVAFWIDL